MTTCQACPGALLVVVVVSGFGQFVLAQDVYDFGFKVFGGSTCQRKRGYCNPIGQETRDFGKHELSANRIAVFSPVLAG